MYHGEVETGDEDEDAASLTELFAPDAASRQPRQECHRIIRQRIKEQVNGGVAHIID